MRTWNVFMLPVVHEEMSAILVDVSVLYDNQFASLLKVGWRIVQIEVSRCVHKKKTLRS